MNVRRLALLLLLVLSACGPSEADIQTAIALTEQARPTTAIPPTATADPTPAETSIPSPSATATIPPPVSIELQIVSSLANSLEFDIWVIAWGVNGSVSIEDYDWGDLTDHDFSGPGIRVHWSETFEAESGDEVRLGVTGFQGADCVIMADGLEVATATLEDMGIGTTTPSTAVCLYTVP